MILTLRCETDRTYEVYPPRSIRSASVVTASTLTYFYLITNENAGNPNASGKGPRVFYSSDVTALMSTGYPPATVQLPYPAQDHWAVTWLTWGSNSTSHLDGGSDGLVGPQWKQLSNTKAALVFPLYLVLWRTTIISLCINQSRASQFLDHSLTSTPS